MTIFLRSAARKTLFALICLGTLWVYMSRVLRVYLAQRFADSLQVGDVERAVRFLPGDAEFRHQLGLMLANSHPDDPEAIANLRNAVVLNPNNGQYWLDLASMYQVSGKVREQNEAVQSALNAEPGNPEILAEAAQYFLAQGDSGRALPLFRKALAQNPQAADAVLPLCWRVTRDAKLLLNTVIPDSPELELAFLRVLTEQRETSSADEVWQHLVSSHRSFDPELSFFYFDYLLREHEVGTFDRDWHELADLSPNLRAYLPADNLIVNAGFEEPLLNAGFDWRHEPVDHIAAAIDENVMHSGSHSLSLSYDGNPAYDAGWKEFVSLPSGADYEFSAWIKSENIISSSGPRVEITDAYSGASLLLSDDVLDTHPWQEIRGTLRVPPDTRLVAVRIVRAPADTRIQGRFWVDDMRLVKR
jgi:tetratricopeptide (TPR) repeat protein